MTDWNGPWQMPRPVGCVNLLQLKVIAGTLEQVQVVIARHILIEVFANALSMAHLPGRLKLGDLAIFNKKIYI